jgi:hypothetical protein
VNKVGKYQLDYKGQAAVTKYHEKQTPAKSDKKQQLEKIRAEYLKKKQKQTDKGSEHLS